MQKGGCIHASSATRQKAGEKLGLVDRGAIPIGNEAGDGRCGGIASFHLLDRVVGD